MTVPEPLGNSLSGADRAPRESRLRPRKTPRQVRAAETRARILDAAAEVFEAHGYEAGTTNRIAEAASMSVGSLYQYFPNKDAILVDLLDAHISDGATRVHDAMLAAVESGEALDEVVRAVVAELLALHRTMPVLHSILTTRIPLTPDLGADLVTVERHMIGDLAAFLAAAPELQIPDPEVAATMVATTVNSLVHARVATGSPLRTDNHATLDDARFVEETSRMVVAYLGAG